MNPPELVDLAARLGLEEDGRARLRIAFGIACVERVANLLTDSHMLDCLRVGQRYLQGGATDEDLAEAAKRAAARARSHPGSGSLDGAGNAAVSASHGVASALAGRALEAAEYAAYAKVYSYASYAVTDLTNYAGEHAWQIEELGRLASSSREDRF